MQLSEKLRDLRERESRLRKLDRPLTQGELVRILREEMGQSLSQSYLSQLESGSRRHLTNTSRLLLARFFKVHPGYLVDDPEGYHAELPGHARLSEEELDLWLTRGAERFRKDPELRQALLSLAEHKDSRRCLVLLSGVLGSPRLAERLLNFVGPRMDGSAAKSRRVQASGAPHFTHLAFAEANND